MRVSLELDDQVLHFLASPEFVVDLGEALVKVIDLDVGVILFLIHGKVDTSGEVDRL